MGSCAHLRSLIPAFTRFYELPPPPPPPGMDTASWEHALEGGWDDEELREQARLVAEQIPWEAECVAGEWHDAADNDLSRIIQGEAMDPLPVERAAEVLGRSLGAQHPAGTRVYLMPLLDDEERRAMTLLGGLLGLEPEVPENLPWWIRLLYSEPGDGFWVGLLPPPAVDELHRALHSTALLSRLLAWDEATGPSFRQESLTRLGQFVDDAAASGRWILGVEGQS